MSKPDPSVLVGQPLSIVRHAADMLVLHFGEVIRTIHKESHRSCGSHALHIQATWRLVRDSTILVGKSDRWNPVEEISDWDAWYQSPHPSREDAFWENFMGGTDPLTNSFEGKTSPVSVTAVKESPVGDLVVCFSDGSQLEVYGSGTDNEFWRLFESLTETPHYVVGTDPEDS